ncbi:hypothetical protein JCM11251_001171 [Rhodosporidiobolus azoricus]
MRAVAALAPIALAGSTLALAFSKDACHDLWEKAPKMLPDLEVYYAGSYAAGTNFSDPQWQSVAYPAAVPELPEFCRFGALIHTSNMSRVQFEVWMPTDWSGRFSMVGNGGVAGGVNFPDMWAPLSTYKMAVASTDTGHQGNSGNGTFAAGNPESQIDFGYRAVHLTTVYSKKIVEAYYGKKQDKSYWIGCSSGGKQGLKEVQAYPEDYDGVIAGAAAQYWQRLNAQTYRINAIVDAVGSAGYLNTSDFVGTIGPLVLEQCDELDGLKDGIITNPSNCKPDLNPILCSNPASNQTACITDAQALTMQRIWADYHYLNGTFIAPGFTHGAEGLRPFSVNGPIRPGPDYFSYQVLNNTIPAGQTSVPLNVTDEAEFEKLIDIALETNPGQTNAADPEISEFLKRGKLLTYVGLADTLIPAGFTLKYWHDVQQALGYKDLSDSYRMFTIPGMGHCQQGPGAWNFGGPSQRQTSLGGRGQPSTFDEKHDMILAMINWVEKGIAPDVLIGTKYIGDDKRNGTQLQRPLCVYPQQSVYLGGDANSADSFACRYQ